ncbi:MAG: ABC transporter permease [Thermoplasmata archaeon]|nr:MAG: ABC transporter permease [Thermoplasmata archaeon]
MNPALRVVEKEMYVYFKTYYTELTYVILFPFLLVWAMELGIGGDIKIIIENTEIPYMHFIAPGIIIMSVVTTAFFNTGFIMLFEKEYQGSFEGVITCPISVEEMVLGKILSGTIKSVLNGSIIIVILLLVIGYTPPWSIILSPLILFVTGLFFSTVGLMLGVIIKRGYQLGSIGNLVVFPPTFLGGIFFDVNILPSGVASAVKLSPVTMMIDGLRKLMVFGDANIAQEMIVCLLTSILLYFLAVKIFERQVIL